MIANAGVCTVNSLMDSESLLRFIITNYRNVTDPYPDSYNGGMEPQHECQCLGCTSMLSLRRSADDKARSRWALDWFIHDLRVQRYVAAPLKLFCLILNLAA